MTKNRENKRGMFLYIAFTIYLLIVIYIVLFKTVSPFDLNQRGRIAFRHINLFPGRDTVALFIDSSISIIYALVNVVGNVLLFIPLGVYMALLTRDRWGYNIAITIVFFSLILETLQYILRVGVSDIDDIILNTIGGLVGIGLYKKLILSVGEEDKVIRSVGLFSTVMGVASVVFLTIFLD